MPKDELVAGLTALGEQVVAKDWAAVAARLSPWVAGRQDVRAQTESWVEEMREEWELPDESWPSAASIDTNPLGVADLRGFYPEELDPDVDADNFVGYGCIQLLASDDENLDAYGDVWVALYMRNGATAVGLWAILDAD